VTTVLTVEQIRSAEANLFKTVSEREVMLRAATGLSRTCAALLQQTRGHVYGATVTLLVGSGNNGGDALFAGSFLSRCGARVVAVAAGSSMHAAGLAALRRAGGEVVGEGEVEATLATSDMVIDGLVGIGVAGPLRGGAAALAEASSEIEGLVVAVDVPSGVNADTGAIPGEAVWADVTVTFGALKPGVLLPPGSHCVGLLEVVDIGLSAADKQSELRILDAPEAAALQPRPLPSDHKYSQGITGVVSGSDRYPGAAILSVGGALHAKSGLVHYCGHASSEVVEHWPSCIVSNDSPSRIGKVDAWAVGPGMGTDNDALALLKDVLALPVPVVVDADALTLVAEYPELIIGRRHDTLLTPHEGEFARLAPQLDIHGGRLSAVRTLATQTGAEVLLKGATTVIASPGGAIGLNTTGSPFLATAGTGDVLAGVAAAYLAAGLPIHDAARLAAFVHGVAGRIASDGAPCNAMDVVASIPDAVRSLATA